MRNRIIVDKRVLLLIISFMWLVLVIGLVSPLTTNYAIGAWNIVYAAGEESPVKDDIADAFQNITDINLVIDNNYAVVKLKFSCTSPNPFGTCDGFLDTIAIINNITKVSVSKLLVTFKVESLNPSVPIVSVYESYYHVNPFEVCFGPVCYNSNESGTITDYVDVLNNNFITHQSTNITSITVNGPVRCIEDRILMHVHKWFNIAPTNPIRYMVHGVIKAIIMLFFDENSVDATMSITDINSNTFDIYGKIEIDPSFINNITNSSPYSIPPPGVYPGQTVLDNITKDFNVTINPISIPWNPLDCFETYCFDNFTCWKRFSSQMTFEMINKTDNCDGTYTYRFNLTNDRTWAISYVAIGIPFGLIPISPEDNSLYTTDFGSYHIENPTNNPFYSIKYETIGEGIKNGQSDIFEMTLDRNIGDYVIKMQAKAGRAIAYVELDCTGVSCSDNCDNINKSGEVPGNFSQPFLSNIPMTLSLNNTDYIIKNRFNKKISKFEWKFVEPPTGFIIEYIPSYSSILIKDLQLNGSLKTIYLNKPSGDYTHVCIIDDEVSDIYDMTDTCTGTGEILLACSGTYEDYICTDLGSIFQIDNLTHTVVRGMVIPVGKPIEQKLIKSGGFFIEPEPLCIELWECNNWSECSSEGVQERICYDTNKCGTVELKPNETRSCVPEIMPSIQRPEAWDDGEYELVKIIAAITITLSIIALIAAKKFEKKKKRKRKKH